MSCKLNKNFEQWWYWWLYAKSKSTVQWNRKRGWHKNYLTDDITGINIHQDCESDSEIYFHQW